MLFLLITLMGSIVYNYQPWRVAVLPDLLLCAKFWLAIYVGRYMFKGWNVAKYAKRIMVHIRIVVIAFTLMILADYVFQLFPGGIRYGIRYIQLFYGHPTYFAATCVFIAAVCIALRGSAQGIDMYFVWSTLLMCASLRGKAVAAAFVYLYVFFLVFYRKKKLRIWHILPLIPIVLLLAWDQVFYYFLSDIQSGSARFQLLSKSITIAKDHFPLGSGYGTFASWYSGVVYSPLYAKYKISNIWGLSEGRASFVSDSFWPMIFAQSGWLGTIAYLLALLGVFFKIQKLRNVNAGHYVSAMCIFIYLVIASTAESAFVNPLAIPLALWMGCLFSQEQGVKQYA